MKLGGYDFIKKPFELEEIVAAVRNAARTRSLEQRVAYMAAQERKRTDGAAVRPRRAAHGRDAAPGAGDRREPRADGAGHRRERHRQAGHRAHAARRIAAGGAGRSSSSTARRSPRRWSRASCSVTSAARSPTRASASWGWSRSPTAARCSSTRSAISALAAQAKLLTFLEQRTFRRVGCDVGPAGRRARRRRDEPRSRAAWSRRARCARISSIGSNAITVHLPPLRERPEDIPALAAHFLAARGARVRPALQPRSPPEADGVLAAYRWPGNVRELRAVVSRAVLMHDDEQLRVSTICRPSWWRRRCARPAGRVAAERERRRDAGAAIPTLEEIELAHIRRVLDICHGNRTLAAQHLGITRQTLAKRIGAAEEA